MVDLTMCTDFDCPNQDSCWRLNAPPDLIAQSYQYFNFDYELFEHTSDYQCEFYINMELIR